MSCRVVVTIPSTFKDYIDQFEKKLGPNCELEIKLINEPMKAVKLITLLENADYFISGGIENIDREVLDNLERLKLIARFGVGYENVDLEAASENEIYVTNAPGGNADSVAELTVGLMLSAIRNIPYSHNLISNGKWQFVVGEELTGKNLGIVGLGEIGKAVARKVQGFQMRVKAFDIEKDYEFADKYFVNYVDLETILRKSKIVTLHVPLTSQTKHLISEGELRQMRKDAYLINTSRGKVVNQKDLIKALRRNEIRGAALDVFETEPLPPQSKLRKFKNLIHTPHIGGCTAEAITRLIDITTGNVKLVESGKLPNYLLNK